MATNKKQFKVKNGAEFFDSTNFAGGVSFDNTGKLIMNGQSITGLPTPAGDTDVATKKYVDDNSSTPILTTDLSSIASPQDGSLAMVVVQEGATPIPSPGALHDVTWRKTDDTIVVVNGTTTWYESTDRGQTWTANVTTGISATDSIVDASSGKYAPSLYAFGADSASNTVGWQSTNLGFYAMTDSDFGLASNGTIQYSHGELCTDAGVNDQKFVHGRRGNHAFIQYDGQVKTLNRTSRHPIYGLFRKTGVSVTSADIGFINNAAGTVVSTFTHSTDNSATDKSMTTAMPDFHLINYLTGGQTASIGMHADGRITHVSTSWSSSSFQRASGIVPGEIKDMLITGEGRLVVLGANGVFTMEMGVNGDSLGHADFENNARNGTWPGFLTSEVPAGSWDTLCAKYDSQDMILMNRTTGEMVISSDGGLVFRGPESKIDAVAVRDSGAWATSPSMFGTVKQDGSASMEASLDLGSNKIINLANPTNLQDAATKNYVDSLVPEVITGNANVLNGTDTKIIEWDYVDNLHVGYEATIVAYGMGAGEENANFTAKAMITVNRDDLALSEMVVYGANGIGVDYDFTFRLVSGKFWIEAAAKNSTVGSARTEMIINLTPINRIPL